MLRLRYPIRRLSTQITLLDAAKKRQQTTNHSLLDEPATITATTAKTNTSHDLFDNFYGEETSANLNSKDKFEGKHDTESLYSIPKNATDITTKNDSKLHSLLSDENKAPRVLKFENEKPYLPDVRKQGILDKESSPAIDKPAHDRFDVGVQLLGKRQVINDHIIHLFHRFHVKYSRDGLVIRDVKWTYIGKDNLATRTSEYKLPEELKTVDSLHYSRPMRALCKMISDYGAIPNNIISRFSTLEPQYKPGSNFATQFYIAAITLPDKSEIYKLWMPSQSKYKYLTKSQLPDSLKNMANFDGLRFYRHDSVENVMGSRILNLIVASQKHLVNADHRKRVAEYKKAHPQGVKWIKTDKAESDEREQKSEVDALVGAYGAWNENVHNKHDFIGYKLDYDYKVPDGSMPTKQFRKL